jgi:MSHA biogenesis protein MshJ
MSNQYKLYAAKFDQLSVRERGLVVVTVVVAVCYLWWYLFAMQELETSKNLAQKNSAVESEIQLLNSTGDQIALRIKEGVNKSKLQQLNLLQDELERVRVELQEKTLELIEPDDMFELMQQMIFKDSKLKLTGLKRKQVRPAFEPDPQDNEQAAEIYRHVMQINFEGSYLNILKYIKNLESLEWKLIWDRISLTLGEYPTVKVEIEISTLSDSQHWVGL